METKINNPLLTISSSRLSDITGINPYQIRKDLSYFGEFGKRGIGYPVIELAAQLKEILKSNQTWNLVLVGAGNLGTAFLRYRGFARRGFIIKAVFDNDNRKIGQKIGNMRIRHIQEMEKYLKSKKIIMGIITVPARSAQEVADLMISAGIKSILNFAPINLKHPQEIMIQNIDIAIELERLVYYLS